MKKRQQGILVHSSYCWSRIVLAQDQFQFVCQPPATQMDQKIHLDCVHNKVGSVFANTKAQPLFISNGPKHPGGILHEAVIVEHPNGFFFEVSLGAKIVN